MKVGDYKEDEIFKDVIGYEDCYQISNYGTVRSKERLSSCCYGKQRKIKEKIIYPSPDKCGYLRIMLCKNKNKKRFYIHELVAKAFCENYEKGKIIHHIDYNNQNNYYKNLYICDKKEHTTIHNLTDTLIRELIRNGNVKFDGGKYYVCKD